MFLSFPLSDSIVVISMYTILSTIPHIVTHSVLSVNVKSGSTPV